ncbi:hypothetical protein M2138_000924 [Dysgonomonadaceae bacterium PH5-43]|nr:hypothetical protein [Dysgonomonadaceae bacterium PH5-43]
MNGKKDIKYVFLYICILFATQLSYSQNSTALINSKPVNIGFKIGINALSSNNYEAYQGNTKLSKTSSFNKAGFTANCFLRINLDNFFMQPETAWNIHRQKLSFATVGSNETAATLYNIQKQTQCLNFNILVGYNIINDRPFILNAFIGPSIIYNYNSKYEYDNGSFYDYSADYNTYGIIGFSFNVNRLIFDIRYQISITNTDVDFGKIKNAPNELKDIRLDKTENILKLSLGVMF